MKVVLFLSAVFLSSVGFAQINADVYQCISAKGQAYDGDNYYNLSPKEIDQILQDAGDARHFKIVELKNECEGVPCNGNLEAQFIGDVKKTVRSRIYGLKNFRSYQINPMCPLDDQRALQAEFAIDADLQEDTEISGVLIFNPYSNTFRKE